MSKHAPVGSRLTAEELQIVARARQGGGRSKHQLSMPDIASLDVAGAPRKPQASYPRGLSAETLGLLGQIDALLKADPLPPRWALLRVLSLLEEHYEKAENATALRMLNQLR